MTTPISEMPAGKVCRKCGDQPARDGFKTCQECADKAAAYQRKYQAKRTNGVELVKRKEAMKRAPAETETDEVDDSEDSPQCGVAGCKKVARAGSTQCERHYNKSLRNNLRYRARVKAATQGTGDGDWKHEVVTAMLKHRDSLHAKIQEIDTVLSAIKGL